MKAFIIEDSLEIQAFIQKGLQYEGFIVDTAEDGVTGLKKALSNSYDIIVIDLLLPKMDGLEFLQDFRKKNITTPVLFLSAVHSEETKVKLLNLGADDYVEKPFSFNELMARIRALLRRSQGLSRGKKEVLEVGDLVLDPVTRTVTRNGVSIHLRRKEFALLEYLITHEGEVLNPTVILEHVWDFNSKALSNTVGAHISSLRQKVDKGFEKKLIHTVHGVGYKFMA